MSIRESTLNQAGTTAGSEALVAPGLPAATSGRNHRHKWHCILGITHFKLPDSIAYGKSSDAEQPHLTATFLDARHELIGATLDPVGMTEGLVHHDPVRPVAGVDPDHGHRFQGEVDEIVAATLRYKRCRVGR